MKIIKKLRFTALAALAVALLLPTTNTQAGNKGKPVAPSNPFVILLEGTYGPIGEVPDLGLFQVDLTDESLMPMKVAIYNRDSGVPRPTEQAVGTFFVQFNGSGCVYDLPKGALSAQFVGADFDVIDDGEGGVYWDGTFELDILEATGIYRSFAGGHIHMVDRLHIRADGVQDEHCFCHFSRKNGKP